MRAEVLRPDEFRAVDLRVDFLAVDFLPVDFLPVDFLPVDFLPVDLRDDDFRVELFFAVDFRDDDFRADDFFAVEERLRVEGTFAPFSRASERPIAIACLRLFTVPPRPPLPRLSVPFLRRRIALSTLLLAPRPYLRPLDFRPPDLRLPELFVAMLSSRVQVVMPGPSTELLGKG